MLQYSRVQLRPTKDTRSSCMRVRRFTYMKTPRYESQRFGSRACRIRQPAPSIKGSTGLQHLRDPGTKQRILAIYDAQEFSRREWKARDFDVYEMPFDLSPEELQCVVPEPYTECTQRSIKDGIGIKGRVFERERVAPFLFPGQQIPQPPSPKFTTQYTVEKLFGPA